MGRTVGNSLIEFAVIKFHADETYTALVLESIEHMTVVAILMIAVNVATRSRWSVFELFS